MRLSDVTALLAGPIAIGLIIGLALVVRIAGG